MATYSVHKQKRGYKVSFRDNAFKFQMHAKNRRYVNIIVHGARGGFKSRGVSLKRVRAK